MLSYLRIYLFCDTQGENRIAYRYFEGWTASRMKLLGTPSRRWEDIIQMRLEAGRGGGYRDVRVATPPSSAEVKNGGGVPLLPLHAFMACTGTASPLVFTRGKSETCPVLFFCLTPRF
jgi:hypothetical protein